MVIIRLARGGAKKRPFFNIVVTDHRNPRDGKFISRLGYYNPRATDKEQKLLIDKEKMSQWIAKGAKLSERVSYLLSQLENNPALAKSPKRLKASKKAKKPKEKEAPKAEETKTEEAKA
jgi:small subunit ribosomal protein S16